MRQMLGLAGGERGAHRVRGGGRARQRVRDRVQERPDQRLRVGQPGRPGAGHRGRVSLGRQRGGDRAQVRDVLGVPGAGRQASWPSAVRPGRSRPRATRCRACSAAAPQQRVAGWAVARCRARTSRGSASSTVSSATGDSAARTSPGPAAGSARTTVSLPGVYRTGSRREPASAAPKGAPTGSGSSSNRPGASSSPSGSQKAIRPSRGTAPGRKSAARRSRRAASALRGAPSAPPGPPARVPVVMSATPSRPYRGRFPVVPARNVLTPRV